MWYGKEPAEDHLGFISRSLTHIFYLYCVVLATFLPSWALFFVDVGMKVNIKAIRKRLLPFHMRVT